MRLTAYDRRRLLEARRELWVATQNVEWALEGNDPALRSAWASRAAHAAAELLHRTDRRITRRAREGSA